MYKHLKKEIILRFQKIKLHVFLGLPKHTLYSKYTKKKTRKKNIPCENFCFEMTNRLIMFLV